jgi:hypothetical protein
MAVPPLLPETVQVTAWEGSFCPVTVALNCWVPPRPRVTAPGVTTTPITTGMEGMVLLSQAAKTRTRTGRMLKAARVNRAETEGNPR